MSKESSAIIADVKRDREASDYGDFVDFTCEDASAQLAQAKEFIRQAKEVIGKVISGDIILPKIEEK